MLKQAAKAAGLDDLADQLIETVEGAY